MRIECLAKWALAAGCMLGGAGCGDDDGNAAPSDAGGFGDGGGQSGGQGDGAGCEKLCTEGGYESGDEQVFADGKLVECYCSDGAQSLAKSACESYCAAFDVPAEKAFLSMTNVPGDKCVCDGVSPVGNGEDAGSDAGGASEDPPWEIGADGVPMAPDAPSEPGTGMAYVVVTNSTSSHLPNGFYETPYSKSISAQQTVSFAETSDTKKTLRLNFNGHARAMKAETFECVMSTDVIVARGMPPGLDNDLFAKTCSVKWDYDAASDVYSGTVKASLSEDPQGAASAASAEVAASFIWKEPTGGF